MGAAETKPDEKALQQQLATQLEQTAQDAYKKYTKATGLNRLVKGVLYNVRQLPPTITKGLWLPKKSKNGPTFKPAQKAYLEFVEEWTTAKMLSKKNGIALDELTSIESRLNESLFGIKIKIGKESSEAQIEELQEHYLKSFGLSKPNEVRGRLQDKDTNNNRLASAGQILQFINTDQYRKFIDNFRKSQISGSPIFYSNNILGKLKEDNKTEALQILGSLSNILQNFTGIPIPIDYLENSETFEDVDSILQEIQHLATVLQGESGSPLEKELAVKKISLLGEDLRNKVALNNARRAQQLFRKEKGTSRGNFIKLKKGLFGGVLKAGLVRHYSNEGIGREMQQHKDLNNYLSESNTRIASLAKQDAVDLGELAKVRDRIDKIKEMAAQRIILKNDGSPDLDELGNYKLDENSLEQRAVIELEQKYQVLEAKIQQQRGRETVNALKSRNLIQNSWGGLRKKVFTKSDKQGIERELERTRSKVSLEYTRIERRLEVAKGDNDVEFIITLQNAAIFDDNLKGVASDFESNLNQATNWRQTFSTLQLDKYDKETFFDFVRDQIPLNSEPTSIGKVIQEYISKTNAGFKLWDLQDDLNSFSEDDKESLLSRVKAHETSIDTFVTQLKEDAIESIKTRKAAEQKEFAQSLLDANKARISDLMKMPTKELTRSNLEAGVIGLGKEDELIVLNEISDGIISRISTALTPLRTQVISNINQLADVIVKLTGISDDFEDANRRLLMLNEDVAGKVQNSFKITNTETRDKILKTIKDNIEGLKHVDLNATDPSAEDIIKLGKSRLRLIGLISAVEDDDGTYIQSEIISKTKSEIADLIDKFQRNVITTVNSKLDEFNLANDTFFGELDSSIEKIERDITALLKSINLSDEQKNKLKTAAMRISTQKQQVKELIDLNNRLDSMNQDIINKPTYFSEFSTLSKDISYIPNEQLNQIKGKIETKIKSLFTEDLILKHRLGSNGRKLLEAIDAQNYEEVLTLAKQYDTEYTADIYNVSTQIQALVKLLNNLNT